MGLGPPVNYEKIGGAGTARRMSADQVAKDAAYRKELFKTDPLNRPLVVGNGEATAWPLNST